VSPRSVFATLGICLAVATGLSSQHLVESAEQRPLGQRRTVLVAGAELVNDQATALELHQPDRLLRWLTGRPQYTAPAVVATEDTQQAANQLNSLALDRGATATTQPLETAPPSQTAPATTAPPDTPPPTPAPPSTLRMVDNADKLRLWAGGDSLGEYVGSQLLSPVADAELTEIQLDYHISTGLARPDYFDWPAQLSSVMDQDDPPEALVFMVGGNDNQNMSTADEILSTGSPEWLAEYRRRVTTVMDTPATATSHLYWIGLPPMRDRPRHDLAVEINQILAEEATARPWVTYVDIAELFSGPDGGYSSQIDDADGRQRVARAPDGVHITRTGSGWVAERVWDAIGRNWLFAPDLSEHVGAP
jgi:hypothetical protein